ncbi:MAG: septum site-determining protein MinD [Clostridiales bacterium]|nr:septum site-determining protein MinD [Clostridiales bacterium]
MSQAWMIASGKGGVGKSTITAALAVALARRQLQTVAVDTDIGLRSLDMLLGLQNQIVYDVIDVANKDCKLKYALVQYPLSPSLSLLPASQLGTSGDLDPDVMGRIVNKLKKRFSYVLMDAPAGLERGVTNTMQHADHTLLVVTPDDVSIRDAERVIALLEHHHKPRPMLLVNRVIPAMVADGEMYSPQTVANALDIPLLGFVPEDRAVLTALQRHHTVMDEEGPARDALTRISQRFLGEYVPMPAFTRRRGWFGRRG